MTHASLPRVVILAESAESLTVLAGVSGLERLLRSLQRLGFRKAAVISQLPAANAHLERRSWASAEIEVTIGPRLPPVEGPLLVMSAAFVYDGRLLRALTDAPTTTLLIDSAPAGHVELLWKGIGRHSFGYFCPAAFVRPESAVGPVMDEASLSALAADVSKHVASGDVRLLDAAQLPRYVISMRREVRPYCFPAPQPSQRDLAERLLIDTTQNGTLDLPGHVHAPLENWIVRILCRTRIRPNHVTFATAVIGIAVTFLYLNGSLWPGTLLALAVGILDGVDGKLARLKIETTELGGWEHEVDYFVELSWWAALASHFEAYGILALFLAADLAGRVAKRIVKQRIGRNLDDVSALDRAVRVVAGRRNIYVWIFALGLSLGQARLAFVAIAWWSAICTADYCVRAPQIRLRAA